MSVSKVWSSLVSPPYAVYSTILPRALRLSFSGNPELIRYSRTWFTGEDYLSVSPVLGLHGGVALNFKPEKNEEVIYTLRDFECKNQETWMMALLNRFRIKIELSGERYSEEVLADEFRKAFGKSPPRSVAQESLCVFPLHGIRLAAQHGLFFSGTVKLCSEPGSQS